MYSLLLGNYIIICRYIYTVDLNLVKSCQEFGDDNDDNGNETNGVGSLYTRSLHASFVTGSRPLGARAAHYIYERAGLLREGERK